MALRRDSKGNVTSEVYKTDAQMKAKDLYDSRLAQSIQIQRANREARSNRSPRQQLDKLDKQLGPLVGAEKERRKLRKILETKETTQGA